MLRIYTVIPILFVFVFSDQLFAQIELPKYFGSNMVLPRDKVIPISGSSGAGESLVITVRDQVHQVTADQDGKWSLKLTPMSVGEPTKMEIKGASETLIFDNVLVGDIWLCAGQSNMQYTLDMLHYSQLDSSEANLPDLRLFTVEIDQDYVPKKDVKGGAWVQADARTARSFSGTGYFFGRNLVENQDVPIGLISSNLGATAIETWMSMDALQELEQFDEATSKVRAIDRSYDQLNEELTHYRKTWDEEYYMIGPGLDQKWYAEDYDDSDWSEVEVPVFWEEMGYVDHDGSFWFRKTFELDSAAATHGMMLHLNQIDDYDICWVNGRKIGETFGKSNFRNYYVNNNIIKNGENELAVRVFDIGGKGGMFTNAFWGNSILNGTWKWKRGRKIDPNVFPSPTVPSASPFSHPMTLYNANIAPLHQLPITGVIWYQGEANEFRAVEYQQLLERMITDWRSKWGDNELPFYIVQLANYRAESREPGDSRWAELRESQMLASRLPHTDIVTNIDIGDAQDIHPRNKDEVGRRLALVALHHVYDQRLEKGPTYLSNTVEDERIVITFETYGDRLISGDKHGYLRGFAIGGDDGAFKWAKAHIIDHNKVAVYHDNVEQPKFVRYAWSDNPGPLDLTNSEGLPAFPFRTDEFELSTQEEKFVFDPHAF